MIPRTPTGDLIAAFLLAASFALLLYVSVRSGRLGVFDREKSPSVFWTALAATGLLVFSVAALIAWEALGAL